MESSLTRPVPRPRQAGVRRRERPRRRPGAAARARAGRRRGRSDHPARGSRSASSPRAGGAGRAGRCRENLRRMEWLVRGYDIGAAEVDRAIADLHGECADLLACDPGARSRRAPPAADVRRPARRCRAAIVARRNRAASCSRSPQEHLLRLAALARCRGRGSADAVRGAAAPGARALRRRQPRPNAGALEEACLPAVPLPATCGHGPRARSSRSSTGVSRRPISSPVTSATISARRSTGWSSALDGRDPAVADLAREVRFRYFDEPVIAAAPRAGLRGDGAAHRRVDRGSHRGRTVTRRIEAIVNCPRPLSTRLTTAMRHNRPAGPRSARRGDGPALLPRALARGFDRHRARRPRFVLGSYQLPGAPAAHRSPRTSSSTRSAAAARAFAECAAKMPDGELAVLDLYAEHAEPAPHTRSSRNCSRTLCRASRSRRALHRIVVAVAEPRRGRGMSAIDLLTFRPAARAGSWRTKCCAACTR